MRVTDPGGVGVELDLVGLRAAIDDMAAWTGLDGVCVPEIRLSTPDEIADVIGHEAEGVYRGAGEPILVTYPGLAFHELCHAVDHRLEDISTTRPDLFDPDPENGGPGERFAVACEAGPTSLAFADFIGNTCGVDLVAPVDRFMREEIFPAVWDAATLAGIAPSVFGDPIAVDLTFDPDVRYVHGVGGGSTYVHLGGSLAFSLGSLLVPGT